MKKSKIKLLDLCCKAGGAAIGYCQAAAELGIEIEITGVDIEAQPNYPFKFIQADAVEFMRENHKNFTHFHASPPCQAHSCSTQQYRNKSKEYNCIIEPIRHLMEITTRPGIIENVRNAPIYPDVVLRGDMFGLKVQRVRHFELVNWWMMNPVMPRLKGTVVNGDFVTVFGKAAWNKTKSSDFKIPTWQKKTIRDTWSFAMGIEHFMTDIELSESIPPAYSKYIGVELFKR